MKNRSVLVYFKNSDSQPFDQTSFELLKTKFDTSYVLEFSEQQDEKTIFNQLKHDLDLNVFIDLFLEEVDFTFKGSDISASRWADQFSELCKI